MPSWHEIKLGQYLRELVAIRVGDDHLAGKVGVLRRQPYLRAALAGFWRAGDVQRLEGAEWNRHALVGRDEVIVNIQLAAVGHVEVERGDIL